MTTNISGHERSEKAPNSAETSLALKFDIPEVTVAEQLQGMVIDSVDVEDFLLPLCEYSAALAMDACGPTLDCAVTLHRRHRALAGTGNTVRAKMLNEIQEHMGQGPGLTALQEERTVVIHETLTDERWTGYTQELLKKDVHSVLAVPLILDKGAAASINFFSSVPHAFDERMMASAGHYAGQVQLALRLAVRIGVKQQTADDLQEAMKARTTIDLAVGVIMGQQRCSQAAAFEILSKAASSRNQKVRAVAQTMLANLSHVDTETHFDE